MKRQIFIAVFLLTFTLGFSQELKKEYQEAVQTFIDHIKTDHISELKSHVAYPIKRQYPLSNINNEVEFEKRYQELFDDSLRTIITSSDVKNDWSAVGWRGIMLNNGILWLDTDGRLISVNYQSSLEKEQIALLTKKDKESIHESIQLFEESVLIMETKKFKVRIDRLKNGMYRYASWGINNKMSENPDLILKNGEWIPDGSGGNHSYKFVNGQYIYECIIIVLGSEDSPPAALVVSKNDEELLRQAAEILEN